MSELHGADELIGKLKKFEKLQGAIPIQEVLTPEFMRSNTKFKSIEEMFEKGGFNVANNDDFEKIPDEQLNALVVANTSFPTWAAMTKLAKENWLQNKMKEIF